VVASRHAEGLAVGRQVLAMAGALGLRDLEADALGAIGTARVEAGDAGRAWPTWRRPSPPSTSWARPAAIVWHLNLGWAAAPLATCRAASPPAPPRAAWPSGSGRAPPALDRAAAGRRALLDRALAGGRGRSSTRCSPGRTSATTWSGSAGCGGAGSGWPRGGWPRRWRTPRRPTLWPSRPATLRTSHPTRAFLARALLAAGRGGEAAEWPAAAGRAGGGVLGPDLGCRPRAWSWPSSGLPAEAPGPPGHPAVTVAGGGPGPGRRRPLRGRRVYAGIGSAPTRPTLAWPRPRPGGPQATPPRPTSNEKAAARLPGPALRPPDRLIPSKFPRR
jgi:hypothetical protein